VRSGKSADAESLLKSRIATNPQDSDSLILMAALKADAKSFDESESLLRRAIAAKPDRKDAYLNLVQLHTDRGNLPAAIKAAEEALAQFPDDHSVMLVAAVTHDTADKFDIAKTEYQKILAKWPDDVVATNNLAALIADVWPQDAELLGRARVLAEKFRNSGDPILLDTLGWVLARQKNYDDAAILLEKATTLAPNNQQLQFHYASALQAKGLNEKAKLVFAKALAGTPAYRGLDEARQQAAALQ
jgi:tetratricopeptide (TPR) repeat protein